MRTVWLAVAIGTLMGNALPVNADIITPDSAVATSLGANFVPLHAIDGSGIIGYDSQITVDSTSKHDPAGNGDFETWLSNWSVPSTSSPTVITFDLGGLYDVSEAYIWQGGHAETDRGVNEFEILTSTNGTAFTTAGQSSLAEWDGSSDIFAQTISFSHAFATHVRFSITSTHGTDGFIALSEVRFETYFPEGMVIMLW